ncbi:MAG: hypothetical protein ACOC2U_03410 [bacterium]
MLFKVNQIESENKYTVQRMDNKLAYRYDEKTVESIVCNNLNVLQEKLLIIGRQVRFLEIDDTIDLLAIDENGNLVIIELKSNLISTGSDFQASKFLMGHMTV